MSEPTYPICERISQSVQAVLQQLVADPSTSGFNTQLSSVERWKQTPGNVPADRKAIIYGGDDALAPDELTNEGATAWVRTFSIFVCIFDSETTTVPYEQRINIIRSDVETIMLAEIKNSTNFGGLVQNCWAKGVTLPADPNELPGFLVHFDLLYRTAQFDPYTLG